MATKFRDYLGEEGGDVAAGALMCYRSDADGETYVLDGTENGALNVGNAAKKFRDGFASLDQNATPDPAVWTGSWTNQGTSAAGRRGSSVGSAYLNISLCPITLGSEYTLESTRNFLYPMRISFGLSISQRIIGQEIEMAAIGASGNVIDVLTPKADLAISGTISVTSNVATINFATNHGLTGGDRVILKDNADSRMNVGPVVVTVISLTQITVPLTITNGTYTAGGFVQWADPFKYSSNAVGLLFENATATQGSWSTRRNGYNTRIANPTVTTTVATQSNTSAYSDAFNAAARYELKLDQEESVLISKTQDATSLGSGPFRYSQGIPDEEKEYKIRIRAKNLEKLTRPVARIISISKTGSTTATVVTDVAHGLNALDQVQIYGVQDQTNFPNLTAQTAIASIVDATTFTIVIGSAVTASSAGGAVARVQGSVLWPGIFAQSIQSISRTGNVLTVIGSGNWTTPLPGENIHIYGCDATSMGLYDGAYQVLSVSTTTLELASVGDNFTSINCGGSVMRRTDVRVHFVTQMEYTRHVVELAQSYGANDSSRSITTNTVLNSGIVTTVSTVTAGGLQIPISVADIASAALTTSTTTATITPAQGISYQVNIPVTAVTGTNPTLDVSIEESDDTGTNWFKVYDFPRITATGIYRSPVITLTGNRIRYVQTVGGTTPSFTRSLNRLQSHNAAQFLRQLINRTINPNTLNSTSASIGVVGCLNFNATIRCTAQTTAATITLQFSHDNVNWHTTGNTLTTSVGIAHLKVQNEKWAFVRGIVSAAGTGITLAEFIVIGSDK